MKLFHRLKIYTTTLILFLLFISAKAQQTVGMFSNTQGAFDGYVLFAPNLSTATYLIDKCGYLVHQWTSTHQPGQSVYLLEDGNLLRPGKNNNAVFNAGGTGGVIEKFNWSSSLLWSYTISSTTECQHHDIKKLPNGNVLAIVWELKTVAQSIAAGRNPALLGASLWSEKIIEVQPTGTNSGTIVWEWHVWDHLIQDYSSAKSNYGVVASHPELINLNYTAGTSPDWLHCNAIDYNAALNQIILSSHNFSELWIIDHSTTTAQAASHSGGTHAKGGDLLYRWGNAAADNRGTTVDKELFGQHNVRWIESVLPDEGNIMVFNNGLNRPAGNYSSVEIIAPPVDANGNYSIVTNQAYQPDSSYWKYTATVPTNFFSMNISGAQRLSNGNTIICEGSKGNFFEIDTAKNTVWKYVNPVGQNGTILSQGNTATQNSVFRCTLYPSSYSGFAGQTLIGGNPIELNPLPYNCSSVTLNLKLFIEGYYLGNGIMHAVSDPLNHPAACDTVIVRLNNSTGTHAMIYAANVVIDTNGNGSLVIPSGYYGNQYYISMKPRNALETWSKIPVSFNGSVVSYDFMH